MVIPIEPSHLNCGDYHFDYRFEISIYERVMPSAEILIPIVVTEIAIWTPL